MAWLEYTDHEGRKRKVDVPADKRAVVAIGRSPSCHVVLKDQAVGRNHGRVFFKNGKYIYKDLGSVNGSYVNGKRVADLWELVDGDTITCGSMNVRFFTGGTRKPVTQRQAPAVRRPSAKVPAPQDAAREAAVIELARLRKENQALRAELRAVKQGQAPKAVDRSRELEEEVKRLKKSLAEKEDENRHLQALVSDGERMVKEAEQRASVAAASLESIHSKYLRLREQVAYLEEQLREARVAVEDKEAESADLREEVSTLKSKLETAMSRSGEAAGEVSSLKIKLTEQDREIERLRKELDVREYDLKALREENERLQDFCQADTGRQAALERKIKNLEAIIEENRNYVAELRRNLEAKDRELREVRLGVGIADLEQEKQRLLDDYHKKSREVDELREELAAKNAELQTLQGETEKLHEKVKELEEAQRTRRSEREDITDHPEYKAKVREVERLTREAEELEADRARMAKDRDRLEADLARTRTELVGTSEKVKILASKLESLSEELERERTRRASQEEAGRLPEQLRLAVASTLEESANLLDIGVILQSEVHDVVKFLGAMDRASVDVPEDVTRELGGSTPGEAAEALKDALAMLQNDVNRFREKLDGLKRLVETLDREEANADDG